MSEAEISNFEKELKHFNIDLKQVQETDNFMDNLQKAIDKFAQNGYYGNLEVVLNENLIEVKNRIGKMDTIFGCKVSFQELEECVSFIVRPYTEKTADQMFEELGYEKETREDFIEYINKHNGKEISFVKTTENVCASQGYNVETITMQELKAINKKCLELGWL